MVTCGQVCYLSFRWGASPKYKKKIGNLFLRDLNQKFRQTKLPFNRGEQKTQGIFILKNHKIHLWEK